MKNSAEKWLMRLACLIFGHKTAVVYEPRNVGGGWYVGSSVSSICWTPHRCYRCDWRITLTIR